MTSTNHHQFIVPSTRIKSQQGAVLIVCLVMLTILTTVALGTVTDISLQSNMAKNSQISLNAFNRSLRQLNAEYERMEDTKDYSWLSGMIDGNPVKTLTPAEQVTETTASSFETVFTMEYQDGRSMNIGGNKVRSGADGGNAFAFEFDSVSTLPNAAITSDQSMGIVYVRP